MQAELYHRRQSSSVLKQGYQHCKPTVHFYHQLLLWLNNISISVITTMCRYLLYTLTMFVNKVLKRILLPKREDVTGNRRKLHTEQLHNWCYSPNIIRAAKSRRPRCVENVARIGNQKYIYKKNSRKIWRKETIRKTWGQEDTTEAGLKGIACACVRTHLIQNGGQWRALVNKVMKLQIPYKYWDLFTI
jgi:hypothetical protein